MTEPDLWESFKWERLVDGNGYFWYKTKLYDREYQVWPGKTCWYVGIIWNGSNTLDDSLRESFDNDVLAKEYAEKHWLKTL